MQGGGRGRGLRGRARGGTMRGALSFRGESFHDPIACYSKTGSAVSALFLCFTVKSLRPCHTKALFILLGQSVYPMVHTLHVVTAVVYIFSNSTSEMLAVSGISLFYICL